MKKVFILVLFVSALSLVTYAGLEADIYNGTVLHGNPDDTVSFTLTVTAPDTYVNWELWIGADLISEGSLMPLDSYTNSYSVTRPHDALGHKPAVYVYDQSTEEHLLTVSKLIPHF